MKLSWGYKIMFVYTAFVAGIGFLAFKANNEKFDLVTKDYYDQELKIPTSDRPGCEYFQTFCAGYYRKERGRTKDQLSG